MRITAILVAAATLITATPAAALDGPADLIRALYRAKSIPDTPARADRFLARDMAKAYKRELADSDNVGAANDFDWRWDTQDDFGTNLVIAEAAKPHGKAPARALVTARFRRADATETITYDLCLGPNGWRIADAWDGGRQWSLRDLLELKGKPLRC